MTTKTAKKPIIPVMEIFGPTIQGEGMVIGRKTVFVRTAGCDYSCAWCDSAFTWDGTEKDKIRKMTADEVFHEIIGIVGEFDEQGDVVDLKADHITISGGNPALLGKGLEEFIDIAHQFGFKIGLETQGSRWQDWMTKIDDLTISPKPPSSKMKTNFHVLDDIIGKLRAAKVNYTLKVVVFDDADFEYAEKVNRRYKEDIFYLSVGNEDAHEEGDISGRLLTKLDWLWEKVYQSSTMNNARPLPQLHTLVYNNRRGV